MKKTILALAALALSTQAFANGSGGVPVVPCYVDGDYKGSIEITKCNDMGGKQTAE